MKLLKKILMTFVWIILILLVTFNVYNFVSIKILHKELPKIFGYSVLEVVSGSMEPTIMVGDLIVIDTDCEKYQKGDIITFRDVNGSFVTHRIVEIDVDEMITKGDNNDSLDEAMSPATIVGKYVTRIPQLGSVMASLKNPLVMTLILIIGVIVCFLVSTDKDLKPKLTDEEKEFLEFKKLKEEQKKKEELNNGSLVENVNEKHDEDISLEKENNKTTKKVVVKKNNNKNYKNNKNNNSSYKSSSKNNQHSNKKVNYNSQNKRTNHANNHKIQGNNKNVGKNDYTQRKKNNNVNNKTKVNNNHNKSNYTQYKKKQSNQNSTKNK